MTLPQWIFHYREIMKHKMDDNKIKYNRLNCLISSVQGLYFMLDKSSGKNMSKNLINEINDIFNLNKSKSGSKSKGEYVLNDSDKELLEFAETLTKTLRLDDAFVKESKYILPKGKKPKQDSKPHLGLTKKEG